jgi:spoIIIJ-associated protein
MNEQRATLEIIAPTVEEAIAKGLAELGLQREEVTVETLDEGSRGLFGLGARQARIRLTVTGTAEIIEPPALSQPAQPAPPLSTPPTQTEPTSAVPEEAEAEYILGVARDTVSELLQKMKVSAQVSASFGPPEDTRSRISVQVSIRGDDLSILIGRRAETLNALQYIAGLIINKEIGRSIPLVVDVEGYRNRRETQLRQIARRMADQAIKSGRRQVLEPMTAAERRIIHIELRKNPLVTTESVGEEPNRKVTIIPKE